MRRPRPRYTILSLMIVVLLASLVLTLVVVVPRERRQRAIALPAALAEYQNATLTREVAEIAVVEYSAAMVHDDVALVQPDAEREADRREWAERAQHLGLFIVKNADRGADIRRERERRAHIKERTIRDLQNEFERAKAREQAMKAEYDRLKAIGTGLFW